MVRLCPRDPDTRSCDRVRYQPLARGLAAFGLHDHASEDLAIDTDAAIPNHLSLAARRPSGAIATPFEDTTSACSPDCLTTTGVAGDPDDMTSRSRHLPKNGPILRPGVSRTDRADSCESSRSGGQHVLALRPDRALGNTVPDLAIGHRAGRIRQTLRPVRIRGQPRLALRPGRTPIRLRKSVNSRNCRNLAAPEVTASRDAAAWAATMPFGTMVRLGRNCFSPSRERGRDRSGACADHRPRVLPGNRDGILRSCPAPWPGNAAANLAIRTCLADPGRRT